MRSLWLAATLVILSYQYSAHAADQAPDATKGKKVFRACVSCHAVGTGAKNKVGPVLNNVIDAKAGSKSDYNYSSAMRAAGEKGLVWNSEKLNLYLKKPRKFIPGTKMGFPGIRKEQDRLNLIEYLKEFSVKKS